MFDLTTIYNESRPLSWSAIGLFQWSPRMWYDKYVKKQQQEMTPELKFGSYVDKRIQTDPDFLPSLERYPIMQHEMRATFEDIPMIGYADHFDRDGMRLKDDKTGRKKWDQKRADETGQLTLYAFFLYRMEDIDPGDMRFFIDWMPTHIEEGKICFIQEDDIHTIETQRTMRDILKFQNLIRETWIKMEDFATRHKDDIPSSTFRISKRLK